MKVSPEEREALHEALDYLLMTRENLENIDVETLKPGSQLYRTWSGPRSELVENASKFLRRVIGPKLHHAEISALDDFELEENEKEPDHLATVAGAVRSFMPLFVADKFQQNGNVFMSTMMEDFMGVYWGDEPRFFSIFGRRQGMHKRPYRLAKLRLTALNWEKYLKVCGVPPYKRQGIISSSYRTSWDAIRKWGKPLEEQYDLISRPPDDSPWAKESYENNSERIFKAIQADGEKYYREISQS